MSENLRQEPIQFGKCTASISAIKSETMDRRIAWLWVESDGFTWMPRIGDNGVDELIGALEKLLDQAKTAKKWVEEGQ